MIKSESKSIPKPRQNSLKSVHVKPNNTQKVSEAVVKNDYENDSILLCLNPLDNNEDFQRSFSTKPKKKVTFSNPLTHDGCNNTENPNKRSKTSTKKKASVTTKQNEGAEKSSLKKSQRWSTDCHNVKHGRWTYTSTTWAARLEHLSDMKKGTTRVLHAKSQIDAEATYCENQSHFILGNGPDFSTVILGILNQTTGVVVKKINVKRVPLLLDENFSKSLVSVPNNPLVAKIHFITRDKTHFYVVRELCENSMKHRLRMRQYLPDSVKQPLNCRKICYDITKSIAVLHSNGLIHMSIKPENVFVTDSEEVKLADYGMHDRSAMKKKQYTNGAVSLCWLPSEALRKETKPSYTKASDISSLGMLICYIITEGKHPFGDPENAAETCASNILNGHYNLKLLTDPLAHHLVKNMIFKEPAKRFTIEQVLQHPFFWSDVEKNEFVELLANAVSLLWNHQNTGIDKANDLLRLIELGGPNVMQFVVENEALNEFPDMCKNSLTILLQYVFDSPNSTNHDESESGVIKKLWNTYPGILLDFHDHINVKELEELIADIKTAEKFKRSILPCTFTDFRTLKPSLSADSGVLSPNMDVPGTERQDNNMKMYYEYDFPFGDVQTPRYRNYSECCTSTTTDDGIDVLSPLSGSFTDENMFSSPVKIVPNHPQEYSSKWRSSNPIISPGSCSSSIDNQFEFDGIDNMGYSEENGRDLKIGAIKMMPLYTDIDELD